MKLYLDTETVGLMGPVKLIQYSIDRGPVQFIRLPKGWLEVRNPEIEKLFALLYRRDVTLIGFNAGFDLFKLYQLAHQMLELPQTSRERPVPPFLCKTLDLYTHAVRVGPFAPWAFTKKTGRRVVMLRRVPVVAKDLVAEVVEREMSKRLPAGVKVKRSEHKIAGKKDLITLSWITIASNGLKALAEHFSGEPPIKLADVWPLPDWKEETWLPYWEHDPRYEAVEAECDKVLSGELECSKKFYEYAERDITNLYVVEDGLKNPQPDHHDAAVECVAYTRYYGFEVDGEALERTLAHYRAQVASCESLLAGTNLRSSKDRLRRLKQELPFIGNSSKITLKSIVNDPKYANHSIYPVCQAMLGYGAAKQRLDQALKLAQCQTGRAHPELRVMGTATNRMAGAAGFNYQGIAQVEKINGQLIGLRACIKTAAGGDFKSFEVAIAASAWQDRQMLSDLDNEVDMHTAVMVTAHPAVKGKLTYEEAIAAKEDKSNPFYPLVKRCRDETKRITFGILYGAAAPKINEVLGFNIDDPRGQEVLDGFFTRYADAGAFRAQEERRFCTADVETWDVNSVSTMARNASNLTGSTRHFDFECDVAAILWKIGRNFGKYVDVARIPTGTIVRTEMKDIQTIKGAVQSAFLGGALAIQQAVCRAAINTPIQAAGGNLTKMLKAKLWYALHTPMLNIHDELQWARHWNFNAEKVRNGIDEFVAEWKPHVKHIGLDYKETTRWSDK
jgi:DNA polymerase I-like protein with 3'-5' exonuclease and polymerase domains